MTEIAHIGRKISKLRELRGIKQEALAAELGISLYVMEMLTTLFRAKLTTGLADFWVAANAVKACTKIVI